MRIGLDAFPLMQPYGGIGTYTRYLLNALLDVAGNHVVTIFKTCVLRRGFRDGVRGIIVALFAGMHTFVKYAKAWELLQQGARGQRR